MKWFVYIDARIRQFLDEAETSIIECRNPSIPATTYPPTEISSTTTINPLPASKEKSAEKRNCEDDPVDLIFMLDTSTSVERGFSYF